jgi:hypothetical protein
MLAAGGRERTRNADTRVRQARARVPVQRVGGRIQRAFLLEKRFPSIGRQAVRDVGSVGANNRKPSESESERASASESESEIRPRDPTPRSDSDVDARFSARPSLLSQRHVVKLVGSGPGSSHRGPHQLGNRVGLAGANETELQAHPVPRSRPANHRGNCERRRAARERDVEEELRPKRHRVGCLDVHAPEGDVLALPGDAFAPPLATELNGTLEGYARVATELDHIWMIALRA